MEVAVINSKVTMVKIASAGFMGDQVELDHYAEKINQYGNVKSVTIQRNPQFINLIYVLNK